MKIERFPLQDRLALLDTGRCAHPEYAAAIIHRFADMTLPEYFQGFEAELERLRSTLGLSREQVQSMTYKQLAKLIRFLPELPETPEQSTEPATEETETQQGSETEAGQAEEGGE